MDTIKIHCLNTSTFNELVKKIFKKTIRWTIKQTKESEPQSKQYVSTYKKIENVSNMKKDSVSLAISEINLKLCVIPCLSI